MAVMTVQFKVGVPRTDALVRLYDTVNSNRDWLPGGANNRPTAIEVSSASNAWREKLAGAGRVWLVRYPANKRDETAQAVEAELQSRYTAGTTKQFRAITVTEFVPKP